MHSPWFTHPWCSLRCLLPSHRNYPCLKLMAQAPEIGCLEDEVSFWGPAYFQQPITMLVSGSVSASPYLMKSLLSAAFFFSQATWADVVCQPFIFAVHQRRRWRYRVGAGGGCQWCVGFYINGRSPGIGSHWSWIYRVVKGGGPRGEGSLIFPNVPKGSPIFPRNP